MKRKAIKPTADQSKFCKNMQDWVSVKWEHCEGCPNKCQEVNNG